MPSEHHVTGMQFLRRQIERHPAIPYVSIPRHLTDDIMSERDRLREALQALLEGVPYSTWLELHATDCHGAIKAVDTAEKLLKELDGDSPSHETS